MNRRLLTVVLIMVLVMGLLGPLGGFAGADDPTLEEQIEESIAAGLEWLAGQQDNDGAWRVYPGYVYDCDRVGATGLVVQKFADRARELGLDPLSEDYEYQDQVSKGLAFIMANQHENPDGPGVFFTDCWFEWDGTIYWQHPIYNTGIAMMAIAAVQDAGYLVVLQAALDYMVWAQAGADCGVHYGGWRYVPDCNSDQSNTGYATLGIGAAMGAGLTVPEDTLTALSKWINEIQNDDGGSDYDPVWRWSSSILRTGNLIYEMYLVGDPIDEGRAKAALQYIVDNWDQPGCDPGWRDHRQAMFTMMKGLEAYDVRMLDLDGDGEAEHDWFAEVAQHLIDTQDGDGFWSWDCWAGEVLSTAWALLTLQRVIPNRPPDCSGAYASVEMIWPPNHKWVSVEVLGVVDPDGDEVTITITGIRQDEPVDTYGDGKFTPDGAGVGTSMAEVRAERAGTPKVPGNGRVYHIYFTAEDGRGGMCGGEVLVGVPHDQRGAPPIDDGPLYDSTATSP